LAKEVFTSTKSILKRVVDADALILERAERLYHSADSWDFEPSPLSERIDYEIAKQPFGVIGTPTLFEDPKRYYTA